MSQSLIFPDKYHIVWLDAHIGDPNVCLQLKRAFFTHVDPESGQVVRLSDKDIDQIIRCQSEIPVTFDSFHVTLKAFVDEAACLQYIDKIQEHRILFIASSTLGQSAVEKLLQQYSHSFTNTKTNDSYNSIYIFCTDFLIASEWAAPYYEYVQIFDFETDLLARMIKDVGEEFLDHGQQLLKANQNKAAIERLSWSKSLFIRHETLKLPKTSEKKQYVTDTCTSADQGKFSYTQPTSNQQPKPSPKLEEINRLLAVADERMRQQKEDDSDDDDSQMQTMSSKIISPIADHLIVWLDKLFDSCEQPGAEGEYEMDATDSTPMQTDDSNTRDLIQLKHEMTECFSNITENLEIFHDMDECRQCITANTGTKKIFFITSGSAAEEVLPRLTETCGSIKKIYILGDYISGYVNSIDDYRKHGIDILLFDLHKNLLIRLLQDISTHYLSKGEDHRSHMSSSADSAFVYFSWAKEMVVRANQLTENEFKDRLKDIENNKSKTENSIKRTYFDGDVEQRVQNDRVEDDSDSVAMIFIVGLEIKLIHLASGIARLITCTTNDQLISQVLNLKLQTSIIVASSTLPSNELLSLTQLLHYFCFLKPEESVQIQLTNYPNVSYVSSIDYLMSQLYHKLGQYYRDGALQASAESQDRKKAKRLLEKSTQCYKLLENDTEQTLKRYAELLKKQIP